MAYVKNIWVDQDVERPKTYEVTNNQDGSITLTDSFGLVTELGTPVNEVNMNHIEDGIDGCAIRKHNLTETFNLGEWVLGGTGDNEGLYKSLIANNVNNAITDTTKWEKISMGASRNIGEMVASTIPLVDAGLHLLDGALLQYGSYQEFIDYIAGLVTDYPDLFCTEQEWQQSVTTYGVCGKFVYDSVSNTVRLPKITGIVEGTTDLTALGDLVEAGLPNITGGGWNVGGASNSDWSGAFSSNVSERYNLSSGTQNGVGMLYFNASRSSSIYGNSTTVQPQAIKVLYYIVVATSIKTQIQVDIDEIATDLNGKADRDGSNMVSSVKNFDGGWVTRPGEQIAYNVSISSTNVTYDISNLLPSDNYQYECLIHGYAQTTATTGKYIDVYIKSDIMPDSTGVCGCKTTVNSACYTTGSVTIPVGSGRTITVGGLTSSSASGTYNLALEAYRRIGTNQ